MTHGRHGSPGGRVSFRPAGSSLGCRVRLSASLNVTLDGCCDHTQVIADEEILGYATDLFKGAAGLLLGRVTYGLFCEHWPGVAASGSGPPGHVAFARELEEKPKFVVSRMQRVTGWNTSQIDAAEPGPAVRALKQRLNGNLLVFGSPSLLRALLRLGAVDEFHLLLQPIVAGREPRPFEALADPVRLALVDSRRFHSGVLLLRYRPAGDSGSRAAMTS